MVGQFESLGDPGDISVLAESWFSILLFGLRCWSRREDLNTPSADNGSAALLLSYTGSSRRDADRSRLRPVIYFA